jgi:hypothetical protein
MSTVRSVGHGVGVGFWLVVFALVAVVVALFVGAFAWYFLVALVGMWKWLAVGFGLIVVAMLGTAALDHRS